MKPLSTEALAVLSSATIAGQTLTITAGQLKRPVYEEVNVALEALGGKWSRKLKAHTFDGVTQTQLEDRVEDVLLTGGFTDKKKELGFFPTPAAIAKALVQLANIKPGMSVLEPSAGRGAIVRAIQGASLNVLAIEVDSDNFEFLKRLVNAPRWLLQADFLEVTPKEVSKELLRGELFDRIVMNPPFAKRQDIEHILHAFKFLKPGGRLVAIASKSVVFRDDKKGQEFRFFVKRHLAHIATFPMPPFAPQVHGGLFVGLPDGTFAESGTNVSTVVMALDRPKL